MDIMESSGCGTSTEDEYNQYSSEHREIITSAASGSNLTQLRQVDLQNCDKTQFGRRTEFLESVDIYNTVEITSHGQIWDSNFPNNHQIPGLQQIGFQPGTNPFLPFFSHADNSENQTAENLGSSNSEQEPLIQKGNNNSIDRWKFLILITTVLCALFFLILLITIFGYTREDDDDLPANFTHCYRERSKWSIVKPKENIEKFKYRPPVFAVISHTATSACDDSKACVVAIRNIQSSQMAKSFSDIAYNFLIAGDGLIYEGRGWYKRSASAKDMGCSSLAVAFVGNFKNITPPQQQINAFKLLMDTSQETGRIKKNYKMFMRQDIIDEEIPELALADVLHKWPHWQPFDSAKDYICQ